MEQFQDEFEDEGGAAGGDSTLVPVAKKDVKRLPSVREKARQGLHIHTYIHTRIRLSTVFPFLSFALRIFYYLFLIFF